MELRQLEYFVAVAEEGGFTRAAARLHVAQPGVSAQIRQLEREMGEPLFDRSGRGVRLTAVGEAALPYARAALAAVSGMRVVADEFIGLLRGRVVMGGVSAPSVLDLPGMLAAFHERHPAVEISLVETEPARLLDGIGSGRFDLGLLGLGGPLPPGVAAQVVVDQRLVVAVRRGREPAGPGPITVAGLKGLPLISLPLGTGLRAALERACARAGFAPHVAFEASEPHVLGQMAARGLGAAVLPESAVDAAASELRVLALLDEDGGQGLRGQMGLVWRENDQASPAARAFIQHARRRLPDLAGGEPS
ncbi:LysR family transcriptional regulator [Nonomuraea sp. MG754425]|uniref:LysR family transcriptional regulator n=1 Tax=Nonomuraea sp. MG754425 TaxID=2570319 RepID=UPI001F318A92|nr:LysR family transcriptional regulator [Nonomuraea sp. MG754425]MCF6475998.1 LysR family transcriptional regulator [Nonomuraea sp. MG754425]